MGIIRKTLSKSDQKTKNITPNEVEDNFKKVLREKAYEMVEQKLHEEVKNKADKAAEKIQQAKEKNQVVVPKKAEEAKKNIQHNLLSTRDKLKELKKEGKSLQHSISANNQNSKKYPKNVSNIKSVSNIKKSSDVKSSVYDNKSVIN